ncbi:MAG: 1-deoxy-D-xylulose-5-phosphate reductoisomerase [candidate division Zixibacteria bacterium]|nr:1-deoxy-D-xylulose-5-phosphate reductoisomerase [candidate division Zixibacteria bacterium]
MRNIVILGSTGSIGRNALDIVDRNPDKLKVIGLAANLDYKSIVEQIKKYQPAHVTMADSSGLMVLKNKFNDPSVKILEDSGFFSAISTISSLPEADIVLNAIVGFAGLKATAAALTAGKTVALANKESMVAAGPLLREIAKEHKGLIIPVDSEHSAIMQCLQNSTHKEIARLILTGSGGPFLDRDNLENAAIEEALKHPNWKMGRKITIDSATMMNKGLEIIEAAYLFDLPPEKISVIIHPQSIVHSMVEFIDGSVIAQMSKPDMRLPIQNALLYPDRAPLDVCRLDFTQALSLDFRPPDMEKFKSLKLAYRAIKEGGISPAVLNAANEVAVKAFLESRIKFTQICDIIEKTMDDLGQGDTVKLDDVVRANMWASDTAEDLVYSM